MPKIWIDNDGCPGVVRDLVCRAAVRTKRELRVVGNTWSRIPENEWIQMVVATGGFDAVDDHIAEGVDAGDLVITADIPLAARVVQKQAQALSPRGEIYDASTIAERLGMRNLMAELRSAGEVRGGHGTLNKNDHKKFADALDRLLAKMR
jgi:uncharacterized protein YaiI (UPF0178 family)